MTRTVVHLSFSLWTPIAASGCSTPGTAPIVDDDGGTSGDSTGPVDATTTTQPDPSNYSGGSDGAASSISSSDSGTSTSDTTSGSGSGSDGASESGSDGGLMCVDWGEGVLGDCLLDNGTGSLAPCEAGDNPAQCIGNPYVTSGVCTFACNSLCDCPAPAPGFESQHSCGDLTGDGMDECFIACDPGHGCPDGMICFFNTVCHFGEPLPTYGDCVNQLGMPCANGPCLYDDPNSPSLGVCGQDCASVDECPMPTSGDAPVMCTDIGVGATLCLLDCSDAQQCPDGMICDPDGSGVCLWATP
jgi:hypothetical protein